MLDVPVARSGYKGEGGKTRLRRGHKERLINETDSVARLDLGT